MLMGVRDTGGYMLVFEYKFPIPDSTLSKQRNFLIAKYLYNTILDRDRRYHEIAIGHIRNLGNDHYKDNYFDYNVSTLKAASSH